MPQQIQVLFNTGLHPDILRFEGGLSGYSVSCLFGQDVFTLSQVTPLWVDLRGEHFDQIEEWPELLLERWEKGNSKVKKCPDCGIFIEEVDGCNHIHCCCGGHVCWICVKSFNHGIYDHLGEAQGRITCGLGLRNLAQCLAAMSGTWYFLNFFVVILHDFLGYFTPSTLFSLRFTLQKKDNARAIDSIT